MSTLLFDSWRHFITLRRHGSTDSPPRDKIKLQGATQLWRNRYPYVFLAYSVLDKRKTQHVNICTSLSVLYLFPKVNDYQHTSYVVSPGSTEGGDINVHVHLLLLLLLVRYFFSKLNEGCVMAVAFLLLIKKTRYPVVLLYIGHYMYQSIQLYT